MSADPDVDGIVRAWLKEGVTALPDRVLDSVMEQLSATHQRRAERPAWRLNTMSPLRLAAIAASISVLAVIAGIVPRAVGPGASPSLGPSPLASPALPPTACPAGTQLKSGDIATIAGTGAPLYTGDGGPAIAAALWSSEGGSIATDPQGALYFSQNDHAIRRIGTDGVITTVAGPSAAPPFMNPTGVGFDGAGNMYVADLGWIWKRDPQGNVSKVAGNGVADVAGDEGPAVDAMVNAFGVTVGPSGDLYFDDYLDTGIRRRIDTAGVIHRFSGTGGRGSLGDGGPATAAAFGLGNYAIAVDGVGNVYLSDNDHYRIRKVDPSGIVTTVVGTGSAGNSGDGGPATQAAVYDPRSAVIDQAGNLIFVDRDAGVVRKVDADGTISTIAGTGKTGFAGDCGPAIHATFAGPSLVAIHDGVLYIVDYFNNRIRMIVP